MILEMEIRDYNRKNMLVSYAVGGVEELVRVKHQGTSLTSYEELKKLLIEAAPLQVLEDRQDRFSNRDILEKYAGEKIQHKIRQSGGKFVSTPHHVGSFKVDVQ